MLPDREALVLVSVSAERRLADHYVGVVSLAASLLAASVITLAGHRVDRFGFGLMAATVALICWWTRPLTSLLPVAVGWLVFDGFVADRFGVLGWHGTGDAVRALVLLGVGVGASSAHAVLARLRRRVLIQEFTMEESNPCRHDAHAAASGADDDRH